MTFGLPTVILFPLKDFFKEYAWLPSDSMSSCATVLRNQLVAYRYAKINRIPYFGISKQAIYFNFKKHYTYLFHVLSSRGSIAYLLQTTNTLSPGKQQKMHVTSLGRCPADTALPSIGAVVEAAPHSILHWLPFAITKCAKRDGSFRNSPHL